MRDWELYADHAARISGAVLSLMRSCPSLNLSFLIRCMSLPPSLGVDLSIMRLIECTLLAGHLLVLVVQVRGRVRAFL
jgi:hypothetical protein